MKKSKKIIAMLLAVVMMVAAFTGCGSSSDSSSESDDSTSTESTTTTSEKTIRMSVSMASAYDPACADDSASCAAVVNMYDSLVYPDLDGTIINSLAEDYTVSDDGLTYTFTLKQGVLFHDGTELLASDVVFSYNRLMTIGQGYAYLFEQYVDSVVADDDYTVTITLSQTFAPFLSILCRLYVVNEDLVMANLADGDYGDYGDYGMEYLTEHDAGSGAYACESNIVGDRITMTKFEDYFGTFADEAPDTVQLIDTTDTVTVRTMMANGELEISDQWQTAEAYEALEELDGVTVSSYGAGQILYLMLNTKKEPTDDVHVRNAIAYMIDYEQVVTDLFPGYLEIESYVGDTLTGADVSVEKYYYDMDKALEEIEASQYADELLNGEITIEVAWIADVPDEEKLALLIQSAAAEIGVTVEVTKVAWSTHVQNVAAISTTANCGVCFMSPDYGEAGAMLYQRLHSDTSGTWQQMEWLQDDEIDSAITTALSTLDDDERFSMYEEIQNEALEQVYGIAIAEQAEQHAYVDYIYFPAVERGVASSTLGYNYLFKDYEVYDH